jgi:hypothetical protein
LSWNNAAIFRLFCRALNRIGFRSSARQIKRLGVVWEKGINLLMAQLQNILIDRGYITSRILAPQQDLKSGVLRLVVMPGYIREARLTAQSDDYLWALLMEWSPPISCATVGR